MSQKTARAARRKQAGRFEEIRVNNEIRDLRAARTIEQREALAVEKAEIKKDRIARRAVRPEGGIWSALMGRWF
ncbi:hypothetical protein PBI_AMELIA_50 [Arthrobacter phage Amelia]|uniref:Uncharacterized protein n=2 Tax=Coralvirus coral TaxID=2734227 RepID=A0A5J6TX28_9CAUD|nr:hypothetical protein PBI_POLKA_50 [Arthrobacter phage Polka]QFG13102.1 hypothetical protein PBI_AMELIA_50 [Arthrobacter phage Amelia]